MTLKKGLLAVAMSLSLPFQALAQGWTDPLTVEEVWLEDNLIVVHTSGGAGVYATGCVTSKYIVKMTTEEARNQAFSLMLTAAATGRTVQFYYKDTCVNWNYHQFSSAKLNAPQ